jgi:signal transduction histidine kinase
VEPATAFETTVRRHRVEIRLTAGFALAMAALLAAIAAVLYLAMGAVLLDEVDTGLRERAATIEAGLPNGMPLSTSASLVEHQEAFAQVLRSNGTLVAASGATTAVVRLASAATTRRHLVTQPVAGVADRARILVVPVTVQGERRVLLVGASLSDRSDALHLIVRFFLVAGPVALVLASFAGWLVARRALATAMATERRFLDHASHELRTPLTALKAELDLAGARPRTRNELEDAVRSAAEETDRLVRLSEDLLLESRARAGRFRVTREDVRIRTVLSEAAAAFRPRAAAQGVAITDDAPDVVVAVDRMRIRQALDNLIDNAVRHARHRVAVRGAVEDGRLRIEVADDGPGFDADHADAFEPFALGGLGLSIVRTVAEAHGGRADIDTDEALGGARVSVSASTRARE